ncbi:MAG: ClpXP protease specificity-enhancing factor SspB [Magnetospirillum sp.]|nr:ClpXP protease specificity-enhancing factor SspB [Magnetospirillum sp.]
MSEDTLRYDKMVEDALRGVVREALAVTARDGLFGDHHFYITFRTQFPGVAMADHILARHPDEMTIVLQHQFWDLEVTDTLFRVTLSFSGKPEVLVVPLAAVTGFADPSAKFGLQFQAVEDDDEEYEEYESDAEDHSDPAKDADQPDDSTGKVVALDAFRKK